MRYRVLGPLEVTDADGRPLDVGGAKPRTLLTLLLDGCPHQVALADPHLARIAAA